MFITFCVLALCVVIKLMVLLSDCGDLSNQTQTNVVMINFDFFYSCYSVYHAMKPSASYPYAFKLDFDRENETHHK